ncbi:hypothetical protein [Methylophaga sulfidovorans]|uniref:Uncharacterized protein n=1 Tax=Methylophaga sulfidovorans TaxID=45496 RepID=A0A1I3V1A6_9GAMM|nr:hypothetical protein [Methylophaga sulfidovorans]SFJ88136.1 hypothetical protein SAMN04488079_102164 [Methylophaga sulfidovorans]
MESKVWKDKLFGIGVMLLIIGSLAYSALVFFLGYVGIAEGLGRWWALGALFLAIFLRFVAPIVVGAIFGAMHLWDWHWAAAVVLVMPGIVLVIPAILAGALDSLRKAFQRTPT